MDDNSKMTEIKFSQFADHLEAGTYEEVSINDRELTGIKKNGDKEVAYAPSALEINWLENNVLFPMLEENKVSLMSKPPRANTVS